MDWQNRCNLAGVNAGYRNAHWVGDYHKGNAHGAATEMILAAMKCPVTEAEDFDPREYFLDTNVHNLLRSLRYELHPDGASKVFKADDKDFMLFVTLRGGQPIATAEAESIFDLGIYEGKGREWYLHKHIFSITADTLQATLEEAENSIRKGEWQGNGLLAHEALDEPFDAREYVLQPGLFNCKQNRWRPHKPINDAAVWGTDEEGGWLMLLHREGDWYRVEVGKTSLQLDPVADEHHDFNWQMDSPDRATEKAKRLGDFYVSTRPAALREDNASLNTQAAFAKAMQQATEELLGDETTAVYGGGGDGGRRIKSGYDINCGMCEEWSERVRELYLKATGRDEVDVLDPGNITGNPDDSLMGHVFLRFNGRYYDAECSQGATDWKQLPLFVKQSMGESVPEPPAEDFDPRQFFLDSSSVTFAIGGQPVTWNFGAETEKEIELHGETLKLKLNYYPDERQPGWRMEVYAIVPWKGMLSSNKSLVTTVCRSERLLAQRINQVVAKAEAWWEKNKWGLQLYPRIYGPQGAIETMGGGQSWAEFVEANAGDLPSEFEKQTEDSFHAWSDLIDRFFVEQGQPVQEADEFDPREYLTQDIGTQLVARLKELGYQQVGLNILTDRHATLTMNDPNPEYAPDEEGGGIDDTKRRYARNRVVTAVRELMGRATSVYDFSGDGGTDYLYKICDPEHMGVTGTFEAEDSFDPREYVLSTPNLEGEWRVLWADDSGDRCSKPFNSPEKAMRWAYTSSLWNKAERIALERAHGEGNDFTVTEYPVSRDYELIDPDTGNILIRETLVYESEFGGFDARDYVLRSDSNVDKGFTDWLQQVGFNQTAPCSYELRQWDTKRIIQCRRDGRYRYAVYDADGHAVRHQVLAREPLIGLLQQHLGMKLREGEEPFDAREYLTRDPDDAVLAYMKANGFELIVERTFYTTWSKRVGDYDIRAFKGQKDEKLGSSRWWMEIWKQEEVDEFGTLDWKNESPGMGAYWSADNFLARLRRAVDIRRAWSSDDNLFAK